MKLRSFVLGVILTVVLFPIWKESLAGRISAANGRNPAFSRPYPFGGFSASRAPDGNMDGGESESALSWHSFFGGSHDDYGESIAVDRFGNIYVTGTSQGTWGNPIRPFGGGGSDAFAAKLNPDGVLQWSTFLGGIDGDEGANIAVDVSGNAYIVGSSHAVWGVPIRAHGGDIDAFTVMLNADGVLQWNTFLGGDGWDEGRGIAVDGSGNAYIAGSSDTAWGSPIRSYSGGNDAFSVKLNSSGGLQWLCFLGGIDSDRGYCISVDGLNEVYVAGNSYGSSWGNPISPRGGHYEVFAAKLYSNGALHWNTYLTGCDLDYDNCMGVAVDASGNVYLAGYRRVTWEDPDHPPPRHSAAVAAKLNSSGALQWKTDLAAEQCYGVAVDDSGNAYLVGSGFPPSGSDSDAYIVVLDSAGVPRWRTFLGGRDWDEGCKIAVDAAKNVYVAGLSYANWGSPMNPYGGGIDAFAAKITGISALAVTSPNGGEIWIGGSAHRLAWTTIGTVTNVKLEYSMNNGSDWTTIIASTPNTNSFAWSVPPVISADCLIQISDAESGNPLDSSDAAFAVVLTAPVIKLSKTSFNFGSERYGTPTPAETAAIVNSGIGTLMWSAAPSADWISVSPGSGVGSGMVTIGIARTDMPPGLYAGTVAVSDPNASNSPQRIDVGLCLLPVGNDAPPFGNYETPRDGATVASSIPVTGWALDDIGIRSVKIYLGTGLSNRIYIGDAVLTAGARPDVEAAYPGYPLNDRAGWGYMLLTNALPNGGNGTFRILAYATDTGGQEAFLEGKTIIGDNLHAVKPFGAIDTPGQGGIASGSSYVNFGWALTPLPKSIPLDGSTITVWVDGMPLGHPTYNNFRSDIATLFPAYANSNGAVGYYFLNTTGYENGVHTIAWSVADSAGSVDGIGSRFFTIRNISGESGVIGLDENRKREIGTQENTSASTIQQNPGIRSASEIAGIPEDKQAPVCVEYGYSVDPPTEFLFPESDGSIRIQIPEISRMAVYLNGKKSFHSQADKDARNRPMLSGFEAESLDRSGDEAYELVLGQLRPIPIGSSFDSREGVFYWQPGPGFSGEYTIVFMKTGAGGSRFKIIKIGIGK